MSGEPRLKAKLTVQAMIRTCGSRNIFATVARKGDEDAGAILIKQNLRSGGFIVLTQVRTNNGEAAWLRGTGPVAVEEAVADAYIARQVDRDFDLWVIEIEAADETLPFDAKVVN